MADKWYCYILKNNHDLHINRTYNGFTNNPGRRIRQHNQDIKGGARYTKKFGNRTWEIYAIVTGLPDKINALQCEWRIKHPDNKRSRNRRYNSPRGRIQGLNEVLKLNRWTNNSTVDNNTFEMEVWIVNGYQDLLTDIPDNVTVNVVNRIDSDILKIF